MCIATNTDAGSRNHGAYTCPATSAELTAGLDCTEVTTDRHGFTKTVGCGFETIEFQSYTFRGAYDLEHLYAASYDLSSGQMVGLVVKEPYQIEPCMSYAYLAGAVPAACPSAVTYKCKRIAKGDATDAPYQGCRSPEDPGCAQCCQPENASSSTVYWAASGSTTYEAGQGYSHPCTCGITHCAQCKLEDERTFRVLVGRHPECNCSLPPTGDFCSTWCASKPTWERLCPGLY
jgi:hypothetical protein